MGMQMLRTWVGVAAACAAGCGSRGTSSSTPLLSVGGDYSIQKTMVSDACEGQSGGFANPGVVRHTPGAVVFVLEDHGTRDLPGTVAQDGAFTLQPFEGQGGGVPGRDTYDGGRFTITGFTVVVRTTLFRMQGTPPAPDCVIVMRWDATKLGPPNVIP